MSSLMSALSNLSDMNDRRSTEKCSEGPTAASAVIKGPSDEVMPDRALVAKTIDRTTIK